MGNKDFYKMGTNLYEQNVGEKRLQKTIKYAQLTTVLIESILCVPTTLFDSTDRKDATDLID